MAALERWPQSGVPDNPGAWLMATAKHRAIDALRRRTLQGRKYEEIGRDLLAVQERTRRSRAAALDDAVGDDLLRLVFICLPPRALDRGPRRADPAAARRADHRGDRARVPGAGADHRPAHRAGEAHAGGRGGALRGAARARTWPRGWPRCSRSSTSSSTRATPPRPATTGCARRSARTRLRLGRILAELAPQEPEVHGLVALMEIQASRLAARTGPGGRARSSCSTRTARAGTTCSSAAAWRRSTVPRRSATPRAPTSLQAAIAACHARARTAEETDWAAHRRALRRARRDRTPSPVVELNRAVAVGMARGPGGRARARRRAR